jgi:hypothetical protein
LDKKKAWNWLVAPIKNDTDASQILGDVSKGWYAIAAITAVGYTFLFYMGATGGEFLLDVLICLLAGYYLPQRKSRAFAIVLLIYAGVVAALMFASRAGLYEGTGGKNIVLVFFLVAMAYRGVRAAFVYHRSVNTTISWKNVLIVWIVALFLGSVVFIALAIGVAIYERNSGLEMSDQAYGIWGMLPLTVVLTITFVLLTRIFPFTRQTQVRTSDRLQPA